jgi:hypothetical protein
MGKKKVGKKMESTNYAGMSVEELSLILAMKKAEQLAPAGFEIPETAEGRESMVKARDLAIVAQEMGGDADRVNSFILRAESGLLKGRAILVEDGPEPDVVRLTFKGPAAVEARLVSRKPTIPAPGFWPCVVNNENGRAKSCTINGKAVFLSGLNVKPASRYEPGAPMANGLNLDMEF